MNGELSYARAEHGHSWRARERWRAVGCRTDSSRPMQRSLRRSVNTEEGTSILDYTGTGRKGKSIRSVEQYFAVPLPIEYEWESEQR